MIPRADAPRRIGVVLLDYEHYTADRGEFEPSDERGVGCLPVGSFESPASWPLPTSYAVARGATARATIAGERVAHLAFADAARVLRARCSVVVADCGFMWAARHDEEITLPGSTVTSGLDLLPHAGALVPGPVGILTYATGDLERLLVGHPLADRLCVVGLQQLPSWGVFGEPSIANAGGVDIGRLGAELAGLVEREVTAGAFVDIDALVLECTVLPQFRPLLRRLTPVPIFDAKTYAEWLAA